MEPSADGNSLAQVWRQRSCSGASSSSTLSVPRDTSMSGISAVTEASSSSLRKSVSTDDLSQIDHTAHDSDGGYVYVSDDGSHASDRNREIKRGIPWTEDEHSLFLTGLRELGKGDWRGISRNFVKTRTPTQVASHAQKYFIRQSDLNRRLRRSSLFNIIPDSVTTISNSTPLLKLRFVNSPPPIVYTLSRVEAEDGSPIAIELVDATNARVTTDLTLEIVALNADITEESWTTEEFNRNIVRPREEKRPLLVGDLTVMLQDGIGVIDGDIAFTDNSSWLRSRKFRLGAKVTQGGVLVSEAISKAFVCKDSRGLAYEKRYPPYSDSEVWRLDNMTKSAVTGSIFAGGDLSGEQKQRQQLSIRGPRPSPLSVNKDSHTIKKPPKLPASQPHRQYIAQKPALNYSSVRPKVVHVHTTVSDFKNAVHRLTGISSGVSLEPGGGKDVSMSARLAAVENASSRGLKEPARDETNEMEEAAEFEGHAPGILSPSPAMLPTPSPEMFSPPGLVSPFQTCRAESASVSNLHSSVVGPLDTSLAIASRSSNNMHDADLSIGSPHQSAISLKSYGSSASQDYDVVVRYRRGDISNEDFISHLRAALSRRGISVHEDFDETDAVPECRVLIIFFTSTYVPSNLLNMVEQQRKEPPVVYPIFYGISPSDLITNSKYYEKKKFQDEPKRWQASLQEITQMPGYVVTDKSESELIDEIVRDALKVLCFNDKENMIGMDTQVEKILSLLCIESPDVRSIGMWGTVGVGKTAIAEEIFRRISDQYETCVFLKEFHKEVEVKGQDAVREDFLSKVLEVEPHVIRISDIKTSFLKSRLQRKKVLIVLDDVNDFRDVETFLEKLNYFGPGSRIIITSRNRHVFVLCKTDHVYKVKPLDISKSLLLLNREKLHTVFSPEVYKKLSLEVVKFSNGNPQVLQLCSRSDIAMDQLSQQAQKTSPIYIRGIFERSCCGLDDNERSIFLDIACFFRRMDKDDVAMLLDGCGFSAHVGLRSLVDKSLLTISHNVVDMVHFIQATGREIVRQESSDRPGDRSRLWDSEDIQIVLVDDTGTSAIEGIFLDMSKLKLDANPNVFEKMCNLRLLKIYCSEAIENRGVSLPQGLAYLPSKLRLLHWEYYPLSSLPRSFDPKNLVELNLPNSCAKKLWKGKKSLEKLKKLRLSYSYQLTKVPRLSRAPNLELLDLEGCNSLVSISQTLCHLKKLVSLNLKDCSNLESVPSTVDLECLEVLNFSGCSKLENFPEISTHVKELYMGGTMIQEIPPSIKNLVLLEKLDLENSRDLLNLPSSICKLKRLETLNLSGCSSLDRFPDLSRKMKCLKSLDLSRTAIKELPSSISYLTALEELRFVECKSLVRLPDNAWSLRFKVEFRQIDTEKFSKLWNRFGWLKKVQIS